MKKICFSLLAVVSTMVLVNCNNSQPTKEAGGQKNEAELPKEEAEETTSTLLSKEDAKK
ncbi:MAG: hypothetical protein M0D57_04620 [Sphingobacteriales bacterium JAD_PAG50586_3]|nr:MAG: hypothetical protein M0D57_04620 [Sphingobacteriales bacterium JAD_PAG50586_3]